MQEDVVRIELSGKASRFLAMLQDFGHIDAQAADDILVALADTLPSGRAELDDVRRMAAAWLFGDDGEPSILASLGEDWAMLFS